MSFGQRVRVFLGMEASTTYPASSSYELQFPVLLPLRDVYNKITKAGSHKQQYRLLKEVDPELSGAIDKLAFMVKESYKGFQVIIGRELDKDEEELQELLDTFEDEWDIKDHFYAITDTLLTYGDSVYVTTYDDDVGLLEFRPLPMENLTILETLDQVDATLSQVFLKNFYVLNEATANMVLDWPAEDITHFALNNKSRVVYDIRDRYTFGVWSVSPIQSLKPKLLWKMNRLMM